MTPVETFNHNNRHTSHTTKDQFRELETLKKTHTYLREEREYNKRKDHAHAHGLPKPSRKEIKLDPILVFPPDYSPGLLEEIHQLKITCDWLSDELEMRADGGVRRGRAAIVQEPEKKAEGKSKQSKKGGGGR